ncbi:MAG: M42 family metallopeptidase [Candidatus Altiarchaeota archaeon]
MKLLKELCTAGGISGFEDDVRSIMQRELEKTCETVKEDKFGNIIGKKGNGKTKIMLAAHMDEVGLMVKHISKEGFISFVKVGGIDDRVLLHQRVVVKSEKGEFPGIIGLKPPHLQKDEERKKIVNHDDMFIDIGAKDKKAAEKKVSVGDPIMFEASFGALSKNLYYGKAVDDRIGCYAVLKVMEAIPKNVDATVYAVGTVQEEVGLKGARVAAYSINPDYAIALDTTISGDTPGIKETESSLKLGAGPAITLSEAGGRGLVSHPKVRDVMIKTAKKAKIPYQIDVIEGGMTDAAIIYLTREGIPSGVISAPTRYIHGPTSVFDLRDVKNTIKLAGSVVRSLR